MPFSLKYTLPKSRLILLAAGLALMSINAPSHCFVLSAMPLADVVLSCTEDFKPGFFWSLSLFPCVVLPNSK